MKKDVSPQRTQFIMMFFAFAFGMILSNLLSIQSAKNNEISEQEILFIYRGIEKTINDITEVDRLEIKELNQKKIRVIEKAALRQYFSDEAKRQGLDIESAVKASLNWSEITESEINSFFLLNRDTINKPLFQVKAEIKKKLELKQAGHARKKLLEDLIIKGDLAILPGA